jgi:membrane-bound lytic murein transglycosylase D
MRGLNRRLGGISFWDSRFYYALPTETREYVPRIFAAAWLFLHPGDFNLEFPTYESQTTEVVIDRELSLGELTICLGQVGNREGWFRTLRNLNPRLSPGDRLEAGVAVRIPTMLLQAYDEHCGESELMIMARELHEANYPDGDELIFYVVRRGDTLGKIASRHRCVSIRELAAINNVRAPRYVIHPGQRLKMPRCG